MKYHLQYKAKNLVLAKILREILSDVRAIIQKKSNISLIVLISQQAFC